MFLYSLFNPPATTELYALSLHDALPICALGTESTDSKVTAYFSEIPVRESVRSELLEALRIYNLPSSSVRSVEHTSELQSQSNLVCPLLPDIQTTPTAYTHNAITPTPSH